MSESFFNGFISELVKLAEVSKVRAHPWHGLPSMSPEGFTNAYIEIVPGSSMKYEIDKETGILKIDRPNRQSSSCPVMYGFIPRTYSGSRVGQLAGVQMGDTDPLDICIISEKIIPHGDLLLECTPIGGFRIIDKGAADDKIIAVLKDDLVFGGIIDIAQIPAPVIDRIKHYFMTYKQDPNTNKGAVKISDQYDANMAKKIISTAMQDYIAEVENVGQSSTPESANTGDVSGQVPYPEV